MFQSCRPASTRHRHSSRSGTVAGMCLLQGVCRRSSDVICYFLSFVKPYLSVSLAACCRRASPECLCLSVGLDVVAVPSGFMMWCGAQQGTGLGGLLITDGPAWSLRLQATRIHWSSSIAVHSQPTCQSTYQPLDPLDSLPSRPRLSH